jgi:hypothetical protein
MSLRRAGRKFRGFKLVKVHQSSGLGIKIVVPHVKRAVSGLHNNWLELPTIRAQTIKFLADAIR